MNLAQMERKQRQAIAPAVAASTTILNNYRGVSLTEAMWLAVLRALYELLRPVAFDVAAIAREFYDSERERLFPGIGRQEVRLAVPSFGRFVSDMEPLKAKFMSGSATDGDAVTASLRVARTIENAGRRTIIQAVQDPDPEAAEWFDDDEDDSQEDDSDEPQQPEKPQKVTKLVKGWARMATGRETCGWCWMLISRGPVYKSMESAGFKGTYAQVMEVYNGGNFDPTELMNQWHTGCDCKVVPVFKLEDYPGKERTDAALELWKRSSKGKDNKEAQKAFAEAIKAGGLDHVMSPLKHAA